MRCGIITQPLYINYGGILQAYALQTVLNRLGHDAYVVQKKTSNTPLPHGLRSSLVYGKRFLMRSLGLSDIPVHAEELLNEYRPLISVHTKRFIRKNIQLLEIDSYQNLKPSDFDAYIVGSDQVWRPAYNKLSETFLQFADKWNVKRIAYAASFGTDEKEYTHQQIEFCTPLIHQFNSVSVREKSGVNLCQDYFGIHAHHVLDPTLLLRKEDYINLIGNIEGKEVLGNLFVYILDPSKEKLSVVTEIEKTKHLTSFSVKAKNDYKYAPLADQIQPPIETWIQGIKDAKLVVTDSFHGCVFSIIFNKPFILIGNLDRGMARIESLLELLGLKYRLISNNNNVYDVLDSSINWKSVNNQLQIWRSLSENYLKESLVCEVCL